MATAQRYPIGDLQDLEVEQQLYRQQEQIGPATDWADLTSTPDEESEIADEEIAVLAYSYWEERGNPIGSPEDDWFRAEQELKRGRSHG